MRRFGLALLLALGLGALTVVNAFAAAANVTNDAAIQIASAIMVIAPLVLPFVLKFVPLDGPKMVAVSYVASLLVALVAGYTTSLFTISSLSSLPGLIAAGTAVFGLSQLVFQLFKDHHTFGQHLK